MICWRVITVHELFAKGKKHKFLNGFTGWSTHTFQTALTRVVQKQMQPLWCDTLLRAELYWYVGWSDSINFYCGLLRNSNEAHKYFFPEVYWVNLEASCALAAARQPQLGWPAQASLAAGAAGLCRRTPGLEGGNGAPAGPRNSTHWWAAVGKIHLQSGSAAGLSVQGSLR